MSWPIVVGALASSVAAFGVGGYLRLQRWKELKAKLGFEGFQQTMLSKGRKPQRTAIRSKAQQLEHIIGAWLVLVGDLTPLVGVYGAGSLYEMALARPRSTYPSGTYGHTHGPKISGILYDKSDASYGPINPSSHYARGWWRDDPAVVIDRFEQLFTEALVYGAETEAQTGEQAELGPKGQSVSELEAYAQEAAVDYLAASIPGGAVVLAIADAAGFGWTTE